MSQALAEIVRFQTDRALDKQRYDAVNEHINIVEELLESIGFDVPKDNRAALAFAWVKFTLELRDARICLHGGEPFDDEKADAYADIIVFAVGALLKLGYDPESTLLEVSKEINSRTGSMVNGKFEKDLSAKVYKADFTKCKIKES